MAFSSNSSDKEHEVARSFSSAEDSAIRSRAAAASSSPSVPIVTTPKLAAHCLAWRSSMSSTDAFNSLASEMASRSAGGNILGRDDVRGRTNFDPCGRMPSPSTHGGRRGYVQKLGLHQCRQNRFFGELREQFDVADL